MWPRPVLNLWLRSDLTPDALPPPSKYWDCRNALALLLYALLCLDPQGCMLTRQCSTTSAACPIPKRERLIWRVSKQAANWGEHVRKTRTNPRGRVGLQREQRTLHVAHALEIKKMVQWWTREWTRGRVRSSLRRNT